MEISVAQQAWSLLASVICGLALGALYDVFRIWRIAFPSGAFRTALQDLLYFFICAVISVLFVYRVNSGEIRWYLGAGAGAGWLLYHHTVGVLTVYFAEFTINFIKKVFRVIFRALLLPFRFLYEIIKIIIRKAARFCGSVLQCVCTFLRTSFRCRRLLARMRSGRS